jgi:hypothetical protein
MTFDVQSEGSPKAVLTIARTRAAWEMDLITPDGVATIPKFAHWLKVSVCLVSSL